MSVDIDNVVAGDCVTIRMRVVRKANSVADNSKALFCEPMNDESIRRWFYNDDIVTHEPRALVVGDIVRYKGEANRYKIVCIDDDIAWIKAVAGIGRTHIKLSHIERDE